MLSYLNNFGAQVLTLSLLAGSIGLNWYQFSKIRAEQPRRFTVTEGSNFPVSRDIMGIGDGRWSIVYWFSPECKYCALFENSFGDIVASISPDVRVVRLTYPSPRLEDYCRTHQPQIKCVSVDVNTGRFLGGTPTLFLLDGVLIKKRWSGYTMISKDSVIGSIAN